MQRWVDGPEIKTQYQVAMLRDISLPYQLKLTRYSADPSESPSVVILKIDGKCEQVTNRILCSPDDNNVTRSHSPLDGTTIRLPSREFVSEDPSVRVIRLCGAEELNRFNCDAGLRIHHDPNDQVGDYDDDLIVQNRESKIPNIPLMIRCQNCDTNFPTKYQFQRHQCEFNADKVVLKSNVDASDVAEGLRMKFECKTCGKQFVSKNNLERHLTCHDEDNVNICEYCQKQFVSENRLRIHKENHCKKTGDVSKFYRSDVTVWRCTKCYQVFASEVYATQHADSCVDIVTDPIAIKNANEDIAEVAENRNYEEGEVAETFSPHVEKVRTELLLQCEFCNRTYANKNSLLWHQDSHTTEVNYNCVICEETFESYTSAAKHWLTDCNNAANLFFLPKLIYCKCCNRTFKSHEMLYLHKIKKKHYTPKKHFDPDGINGIHELNQDNQEKQEDLDIPNDCDDNNNHDDQQDNEFDDDDKDLLSMDKQIKSESDLKENKAPPAKGNKANIIQLIENVLGKNDDVDVKNSGLTSEGDVSMISPDDSMEENGKNKRGRKRKTTTMTTKTKKIMTEVEDGYKYQCERCVALFNTVMDMEIHRNKEHPANYKCDQCDQVVHSTKALMIHSRAHKSLKPYVCEICKRCYSQTSHLWQHMRFHQGIKPFACPHEGCEARYTIRPDLKDHIRKVHTRERPFKCTVCDKCFLTGSVYYQHRLIHTNDRRYACDICEKRFFRADALNNHRRIHTDERPYPCSVCGRNFRQKGDRNKHVRTQHPDCQT